MTLMEDSDFGKAKLLLFCTTTTLEPCVCVHQMELYQGAINLRKKYNLDLSKPASLSVDGKNPLYEACRSGNIPLVKLFLQSGAELNTLNSEGITPLYYALTGSYANHKMLDFLLGQGANPNIHGPNKSLLMWTFTNIRLEVTMKLLKAGADANLVILPTFSFTEAVFGLNSNFVLISHGVIFHLYEFQRNVYLAAEMVYAGLRPRTFFINSNNFLGTKYSDKEMNMFWSFQCVCLAAGFRVDLASLRQLITDLLMIIPTLPSGSSHQTCLRRHLDNMYTMKGVVENPLSLTRQCRVTIRGQLAHALSRQRGGKPMHLHKRIEFLPVPKILKDFLMFKSL